MRKSCFLFMSFFLVGISAFSVSDDIHSSIEQGDIAQVKKLLKQNPLLLEEKNVIGYTPLQLAAMKAQWEIADYLFQLGANVHDIAPDGGTVLHRIAHYQKPDVIRVALKLGCKVNTSNRWGRTALHVAARRGCLGVAGVLIDSGADISAETKEGWTALHVASKSGQKEVYDYLVSVGIEADKKDKEGKTASDYFFRRPSEKQISLKKLTEYCGDYHFGGAYWVRVWLENGRLMIEEFSRDQLYSIGKDKFYCRQEPWEITFKRNSTDQISGISLKFLRRTVTAVKKNRAGRELRTGP